MCIAGSAPAPSASAQEPPAAALEWEAERGCISAEELAAGVDSMLGTDVFGPSTLEHESSERLAVVGRARRESAHSFVIEIELRRRDGETLRRDLRAAATRCRELDSIVVVAVGLLVDDAARQTLDLIRAAESIAALSPEEGTPPARAPPEEGNVARPSARPPTARRRAPPSRRTSPRDGIALSGYGEVGASMSVGLLPSPAFALAVGGGVVLDRLRVSAAVARYPGAQGSDSPRVLVDATIGNLSLGFLVARTGMLELSGAIGLSAGAFRGRGVAIARSRTTVLGYLDASAAARVELQASEAIAAFAWLGASTPIVSPRFLADVDGVSTSLHEPAPVAAALAVGLAARFR